MTHLGDGGQVEPSRHSVHRGRRRPANRLRDPQHDGYGRCDRDQRRHAADRQSRSDPDRDGCGDDQRLRQTHARRRLLRRTRRQQPDDRWGAVERRDRCERDLHRQRLHYGSEHCHGSRAGQHRKNKHRRQQHRAIDIEGRRYRWLRDRWRGDGDHLPRAERPSAVRLRPDREGERRHLAERRQRSHCQCQQYRRQLGAGRPGDRVG